MESASTATGHSYGAPICRIKRFAIEDPARMPARISGAKASLPAIRRIAKTSVMRRSGGRIKIPATGAYIGHSTPRMSLQIGKNSGTATAVASCRRQRQ